MNDHSNQHTGPDLDALLGEIVPEEADRLREVWNLTADAEPVGDLSSVETEEALRRVREAFEARSTEDSPPSARERERTDRAPQRAPQARQRDTRTRKATWPTAAALLAAFLAGTLAFYWWQRPITRTAPLGERLAFRLPDGSHVELNSGSTLRYERQFGEQRSLRLDGEAFFEVEEGSRPFIVRTFNADIRVLGTDFNVRAWADDPAHSTLVTVTKGRVALGLRETPGHTVQLKPGETQRVKTGRDKPITSLDISTDEVTAWRRGDLIAKDQPLGRVLREVERRFAIDLRVDPSSLRRERINIALRQPEDGEAVIRDLSRALGLKYRETSTGFVLYK